METTDPNQTLVDASAPAPPEQAEVDHVALDPAQQSLADALKVSFTILKVVMVVLVVVYLFSGLYSLDANEEAVHLRNGAIVSGSEGDQITVSEGTHFALPFPLEEVLIIDKSQRVLELNKAFFPANSQQVQDRTQVAQSGRALNPITDGSLLTGDANIVHAQWRITYAVDDASQYAVRVGDADLAAEIVQALAEQAVIHATARSTAEGLFRGQTNSDVVRRLLNEGLRDMETGMVVTAATLVNPQVPGKVLRAFDLVTSSESQKSQAILAAEQEKTRILSEAAGEGYKQLLTLIDQLEIARLEGDEAAITDVEAELTQAFDSLSIGEGDALASLGGEVASRINEARGYRTEIESQYESEKEQFLALRDAYVRAPRQLTTRLWEDARADVLAVAETFYVPHGIVTLLGNRDPQAIEEASRKALADIDQNRFDLDDE